MSTAIYQAAQSVASAFTSTAVTNIELLAKLEEAERKEAQSFLAARRGSLAMHKRRQEKRRLLAAVAQAREAVQMNLSF